MGPRRLRISRDCTLWAGLNEETLRMRMVANRFWGRATRYWRYRRETACVRLGDVTPADRQKTFLNSSRLNSFALARVPATHTVITGGIRIDQPVQASNAAFAGARLRAATPRLDRTRPTTTCGSIHSKVCWSNAASQARPPLQSSKRRGPKPTCTLRTARLWNSAAMTTVTTMLRIERQVAE
jgi:hypothetical protein